MIKAKKSKELIVAIPVTWAAIIFEGKPFSSIPESEVEDFKNWYPRKNWMPDRTKGKPFYRTGIPFVTRNKRQDVIEVVFDRKERNPVPDFLNLLSGTDDKELLSLVTDVNGPTLDDVLSDAFKFHMEINK